MSFETEMRHKLLLLREQLGEQDSANAEQARTVELDQTRVGRLSRMDALQAQAMAQASGRRRRLMLSRIAAALERIDNGNFGDCQSCDEPIPKKRLEIDPTALFCVACADKAGR
jgi:DnaK suppressor protein